MESVESDIGYFEIVRYSMYNQWSRWREIMCK